MNLRRAAGPADGTHRRYLTRARRQDVDPVVAHHYDDAARSPLGHGHLPLH
jgi:hypothetical protein